MNIAFILITAFIVLSVLIWILCYPAFKRLTNFMILIDICRVLRSSEIQTETMRFAHSIKGLTGLNQLELNLKFKRIVLADYLIYASSISKKLKTLTQDDHIYDQTIWRVYEMHCRKHLSTTFGYIQTPLELKAFNMVLGSIEAKRMDGQVLSTILVCTLNQHPEQPIIRST